MDTQTLTVGLFITSIVFAIFGYFLKMIHGDVRKNTEEQGRL
jgi:hypothetical protein